MTGRNRKKSMPIAAAPALVDKKVRKVYIKDGRRRMMTDSGIMLAPASLTRLMFGKSKGGKYSHVQDSK